MSDNDRPQDDDMIVDPAISGDAAAVTADTTDHRPIWERERDEEADDKAKPSAASETIEIVKSIVYALLIAFVLRTLFFQPFTIPSASMEPNLYEGDYIVVSKWSYGYSRHSVWPSLPSSLDGRFLGRTPERGDVVVFKWPGDDRTDYIKRLIGLPGDRIQVRQNRLYLNGVLVEDQVTGTRLGNAPWGERDAIQIRETLPGGRSFNIQDFGDEGELDNTEEFVVPTGYYFMMGDNRDNSLDSRAPTDVRGVGFVKAENLLGKAQIVMFSWTPGASLFKPWTWFTHVRPSRFFHPLR